MKKFTASFLSLLMFLTLGVVLVSAQPTTTIDDTPTSTTDDPPTTSVSDLGTITFENPLGSEINTIQDLFEAIIDNIILPIGGVLAVLAFIYSGFLYVTAQGNQSKLETAHKALLYTAVGTAVLLGASVIATVLDSTVDQLLP